MMFDAPAVGFESRGLFVADTFGEVEIDQLAERERLAVLLARHRGIAAARDFG